MCRESLIAAYFNNAATMIRDKVRVEVKETRSYTARSRMTTDYLRPHNYSICDSAL